MTSSSRSRAPVARPVYSATTSVGAAGKVAQRDRAGDLHHHAEHVPAEHAPVRACPPCRPAGASACARRRRTGRRRPRGRRAGRAGVGCGPSAPRRPTGPAWSAAGGGRCAGPRRRRPRRRPARPTIRRARPARAPACQVGQEAHEQQRDLARQHQPDDQPGLGEDEQRGHDVHRRRRQLAECGDQAVHAGPRAVFLPALDHRRLPTGTVT